MVIRPLLNKRVLVTRPAHLSESFCQQLKEAGAIPVRFPVISLAPMENTEAIRQTLSTLHQYDWVVFTSVNGVYYALEELTLPWPECVKVAAIGPATRDSLVARGIDVHYMPAEFRAERIADGVDGERILLLRAAGARPALRKILQYRGSLVEEVPVYFTHTNTPSPASFAEFHRGVDAITFTSSSTVRSFTSLVGNHLHGPTIACIGPITADAATQSGFCVGVVATDYTTKGLVNALKGYYAQKPG